MACRRAERSAVEAAASHRWGCIAQLRCVFPCSLRAADEHDKYAFEDHGHRFDFLLKPLPPTEEEEAKP